MNENYDFSKWKQNQTEQAATSSKIVLIFLILSLIIAALSACKTQGYGCKGKETWNHMVKRINR